MTPTPPRTELEKLVDNFLFILESMRIETSRRLWRDELASERNQEPKRLLRYGYKVYSQDDEDGIIAEIFKRIGIEFSTFVEIGVQSGIECNTVRLLVDGWKGMWIEAGEEFVRQIRATVLPCYPTTLTVRHAMVTAENINSLVADVGGLDLLSIDIDGNDYWVWNALDSVRPRVVVIEYNGTLRPPLSLVVPYDSKWVWDLTNYYGASLEALVRLGRRKGYKLVGCNYSGGNAFFVRNDLVESRFVESGSAEDHYEPPRRFPLLAGHFPRIGTFAKGE